MTQTAITVLSTGDLLKQKGRIIGNLRGSDKPQYDMGCRENIHNMWVFSNQKALTAYSKKEVCWSLVNEEAVS